MSKATFERAQELLGGGLVTLTARVPESLAKRLKELAKRRFGGAVDRGPAFAVALGVATWEASMIGKKGPGGRPPKTVPVVAISPKNRKVGKTKTIR